MPDVSANVTSVSPVTTKIIKTIKGTFIIVRLSKVIFWLANSERFYG